MSDELKQHNLGQKHGANAAPVIDELLLNFNPFVTDAYKHGFRHALEQQRNRRESQVSAPGKIPTSTGGGGGGGGDSLPFPILLMLLVPAIPVVLLFWMVRHPKSFFIAVFAIGLLYFLLQAATYAPAGQLRVTMRDLFFFYIFLGVGFLIGCLKRRPVLGMLLGFLGPIGWIIISLVPSRWEAT